MLVQRSRNGVKQYCYVSSDGSQVLQWFGKRKPSKKRVESAEKRVRFFKNKVYEKIPTRKKFD